MSGPRFYIASKSKHGRRWLALRSAHDIVSTWIDECDEGATTDWLGLWERCVNEASRCDILVAYHEPGEEWKGAFVEIGAALACGVPVWVVGDPPGSWVHHPLVMTPTSDTVSGAMAEASEWWADQ